MKTQVYSSSPKRKLTLLTSFLVMLFCALCSTTLYAQDQEAYVETDAPDYAPGSTVIIAGEYWTPGETVYLKVTHLSPLPVPDVTGVTPNPYDAWTVIADANGEVHTTWYVNDFELGAQLQLEAYTASGYDYRTFFTDAANKIASISINTTQAGSLTYGTPASVTYSITITPDGGASASSADLSLTETSLPTGATATWSIGPTNITLPKKSTDPINITLTIKSTALLSAGTTSGITVTASAPNIKVSNSFQLVVDKAPLSVTAANKSKIYDGAIYSPFTVDYSGFVNGQNASILSGTLSFSGTAVTATQCGTYTITPSGLISNNYNITFNNGSLTIGQRPTTIIANAKSKIYGDDNPALTAVVSGTVNGDLLSYSLATTALKFSSVGTYPIAITLGSNPNYSITPTNALLTVGQKSATVVANAKSKTYGDANPTLDAVVSGTVNGDALHYTLATTASQFSNVGDYPITITLDSNPNYSVTPTNALLTVGQKTATVVANAKSKTYGDANPTLDAVVSGTVNGDALNYTLATTASQFSNVGDYPITITLDSNPNYSVTPTNALLTVGQKTATVVANAKSKTYGDANPTLDAVVSGTVNGDALNYTLATTASQFSNVGDYPITITLDSNPNYSITPTDALLTVGQKAATVVADAQSKIYGDDNPTLTAVVSGTVNGDLLSYSLATTALKFSSVGTYPIAITLGSNPNYSITPTDALLTVGQKAATVVADAQSKIYGDDNPALTAVVSGTVNGDLLSYSLATTALKFSSVGTYPIAITLGSNPNYSITPTDALLTVGQKAATVVADAQSKIYGDDNPTLTAVVSGTVNGNLLSYSLATTALKFSSVGTYPIAITLGSNPNYSITPTNALLTVGQKTATVVANAKSKTYGDANPTLDAVVSGTVNGDALNYTLATTASQFSNVGDYPITITLESNPNYSVTPTNALLTVGQKAATVVADAQSKIYGDDNPALTAVVSGTVNGDLLSYSLATTALKFSSVGTYPIAITLGSNPNYSITPTDALLTVGQKTITVTADDGQTKLYGNIDPIFTYKITSGNLVNGDVLNGQLSRDSGENVGSYSISMGTLANSNYKITFVPATFVITPCLVTVTPNSGQSKTYGTIIDPVIIYNTNPASLPNGNTVSLNGSLTRNAGESVGSYAILQNNIVTANNPNYTITFADGIMFAITPSSVTATVTMNKDSVQYSDVAVFTATLTGGAPLLTGGPQAATSATFYIGTQSMGTANLTVNGNDLVATLTATLLETTADQMMPGNKTLKVNFNGINSNYDVPASKTSNVIITRENAIASYSGAQFASTSGISSSSAIVTLAATIQDITATYDTRYDAYPGDIRKAKVRFMNMDSNTPITAWLPVALISSNDLKTGTVMYDWTTDIGNNDALQFTLGVQVDGYYVGTSDNTIVTVAKPLDNFVTGGGNVLLTNAVSGTKDGDIGSKLNFGFNVKYDASKNELKGHFNAIIFRTEDQWGRKCMPNHGMLHQIKIDGDDMISLAVVPATGTTPATATFTGKLDVRDNQHSNVLFANGATVMVTMTDYGEPGKNDRLGITIWNPDGSLLFSSNWALIRTAEQKLNDGNLEIHSKVVFKTGSVLPTVNLVATPTSGVKGTPITFNVAVKGSKSVPTGSVTFKDITTNTVLATVALSNGSATFTTSSLGVGTHNVDAYYGGNNTYKSGDDDVSIEITMPSNSSAFNSEHADLMDLNVYPNPFGSHLFLRLQTPEDTRALLEVFDISGRKIAVVVDQAIIGNQPYTFEYIPAGNVAPGMLIYRLTVGQKVYMGKVIYQPR